MKLKALINPDINQWTQQILYLSSFSYNSDVISQIINFNSFSSNYEIYKLYKKKTILYQYADIYMQIFIDRFSTAQAFKVY